MFDDNHVHEINLYNDYRNSLCDFILCLPDTEDASETDMAKREEEFTEIKEQYVATVL